MRTRSWFVSLCLFLSAATPASAQSGGVRVEVDDVTDNRVESEMLRGDLHIRLKVSGASADKATAARVIIKEAKDDRGTVLVKEKQDPPDFEARDTNSGSLSVSLLSPARTASKVRMKGTIELFTPARDPNATITIKDALKKLDAPLASKALDSAKISLTPLSRTRYKTLLDERKLTEAKIAEIRAEAKKAGASDKEVELALGFAKAMEMMDGEPAEGTIFIAGKEAAFDRIYRIEILGADGKPIDTSQRGSSTRGDDTIMTIVPREPPPAGAVMQIQVVTEKSKVSSPFELSLDLP